MWSQDTDEAYVWQFNPMHGICGLCLGYVHYAVLTSIIQFQKLVMKTQWNLAMDRVAMRQMTAMAMIMSGRIRLLLLGLAYQKRLRMF
jgi:hypothetical protein